MQPSVSSTNLKSHLPSLRMSAHLKYRRTNKSREITYIAQAFLPIPSSLMSTSLTACILCAYSLEQSSRTSRQRLFMRPRTQSNFRELHPPKHSRLSHLFQFSMNKRAAQPSATATTFPFEVYNSQWTNMAILAAVLSVTCFIGIMVLVFWLFKCEQSGWRRETIETSTSQRTHCESKDLSQYFHG